MAITGLNQKSGGGGEEFSDPTIMAEINITPLTDVFLVLLIIFMVTSTFLTQSNLPVNLPQAKHGAEATPTPGVIVTVQKDSQILINGQKVPEENLSAAIASLLSKSEDKTVVLEGDREAVLGTVVRIMDEAKKAGATKFAVATQSGKD